MLLVFPIVRCTLNLLYESSQKKKNHCNSRHLLTFARPSTRRLFSNAWQQSEIIPSITSCIQNFLIYSHAAISRLCSPTCFLKINWHRINRLTGLFKWATLLEQIMTLFSRIILKAQLDKLSSILQDTDFYYLPFLSSKFWCHDRDIKVFEWSFRYTSQPLIIENFLFITSVNLNLIRKFWPYMWRYV